MHSLLVLTRYELYRLVRTRKTWGYLAVGLLVLPGGWTNPYSPFTLMLVNASAIVAMYAGHVVADDFASGFVKNVLVGHRARAAYVGAVLLSMLAVVCVFMFVKVAACGITTALNPTDETRAEFAGLDQFFAWCARPETWAWFAACVFAVFVHVCQVLVVAVLTGSKPLSVLAGHFCGSGLSELLALSLMQSGGSRTSLFALSQAMADNEAFPYLSSSGLLDGAPFSHALPWAMGCAVVVLAAALMLAVLRRKDVSGYVE